MSIKYKTMTFVDVWDEDIKFLNDYKTSKIPQTLSEQEMTTIYYLLYARYGNNPIANFDVNQFKYKVWSIIFQFGPVWSKRLEIQEKIRQLTDQELMTGSKAIYNKAFNPDDDPSTISLEEITKINEQSTTGYKKAKMEAYREVWELLKTDISTWFFDKFAPLFKMFVINERPVLYEDLDDDFEEEED